MLIFYLAAIEMPDQKAKFEYVYRHYFDFMYKTAYSVTKTPDLTEDAVHETFLQIIEEIDLLRIDNEKELKSYLYILTRSRTIDLLRKWQWRRCQTEDIKYSTVNDTEQDPNQIVLTRLQLEQVLETLSNLPDLYRKSLTLRVKGYSIKEIAEITHSSEANVKNRIHRARKSILRIFRQDK